MTLMMTNLPHEPARREDAAVLADLVVLAGDGLPLVVWEAMAEEGEDAMAVGRRRARRAEGAFSYAKADVIRQEGAVVSALVSYPLTAVSAAEEIAGAPPLFRPLLELENRVVPSWYVNVLATLPHARGQGAATTLLRLAESKARAAGHAQLSLITGDINPARRLYEGFGFGEIARAQIVKEGWSYEGSDWVLYAKQLA